MIKLQAQNEKGWPFTFYIEKATPTEEDGNLLVEGVASTVNVDHDHERMAESALHSMSNIINEKGVPLRLEHSKEDADIIGTVYKAWVDERNQLWIKAAIEKGNKTGAMIHEALKQGAKFGLSVGGRVRNAVREMAESTGKAVKTFYDVILEEVSVTRKPANYDAWLFAKSYKEKSEDIGPFLRSPLYNEFLFENQQLDYLRQFAKSVPDKAWSKISSNNINKSMNDEKKKEGMEKADENNKEEEATKSFVTKSDFTKFAGEVSKGMSEMAKAMAKAFGNDAPKDAVNPNKDKETEIADETTAKAREGQEDDGGNGTESAEGKKEAPNKAQDQEQPGKAKPVPAEQQTAKKLKVKSMEEDGKKEKAEDGDKADKIPLDESEKSEDGEKKDDMDKAEDGEKKDDMDKGEDGDKEEGSEKAEDGDKDQDAMKSINRATKSITALIKAMSGDKVSKSEKIEKSSVSDMDRFAFAISNAFGAMNDRFEKSGIRVPGLAKLLTDTIKNDPQLQKEISSMINLPGIKKSVSRGIPYMITKDGQAFALSATPLQEKVQKSEKDGTPKTFKSVYQTEMSAFRSEAEI